VAARIVPAATGTDTGGSIRQPAAFTGISGIKPTYGRCSRWGIVAFASSSIRPGRWRIRCRLRLMLEAMAGFDPKDATSLDMPVPDWSALSNADLKGKKVGIPREYRIEGLNAEVAKAGRGHCLAQGCRGRGGGHFAAAFEICAGDLLHHRACRGFVEPRAL
jgi:aspartyl-tRNA(Asn)/glutamyl-tRNA(Gln) amidotransferase subunit A